MLQKLSKCEVKAWLCWNLMILLPLRFYVKSNFGKCKRSKNVIFCNFRDSEVWILVNLGLESCSNILETKIQTLKNCQKRDFLTVWIRQNLISCYGKIIKLQQSQALTSHFESFWSIVQRPEKWKVLLSRETISTFSIGI